MLNCRNNRGFTLLEILVALFIFAILGAMTAVAFHSVLKTHQAIKQHNQQIQKIEFAMIFLRQDFNNVIDRPVIDANGHESSPLLSEGLDKITFTRTGVINPEQMYQRSDMQRVGYELKNHEFIRLSWDVLDQPPNTKPMKRVLLRHIKKIQIQYIDMELKQHMSWPLAHGTNIQVQTATSDLPQVVIITLWLQHRGRLQIVLPVRSRGFLNANAS